MNREPVVSAAGVVTLVQTLLLMLVGLGFVKLSDDQVGSILAFVAAAVALVAPLAAAFAVRGRVTPVVDPRAADGMPLVRASEIDDTVAIKLAAARMEDLRVLRLRAAEVERQRAADAATGAVARICVPGVTQVDTVAPGVEHAPEPGLREEVRFDLEQAPVAASRPRRVKS